MSNPEITPELIQSHLTEQYTAINTDQFRLTLDELNELRVTLPETYHTIKTELDSISIKFTDFPTVRATKNQQKYTLKERLQQLDQQQSDVDLKHLTLVEPLAWVDAGQHDLETLLSTTHEFDQIVQNHPESVRTFEQLWENPNNLSEDTDQHAVKLYTLGTLMNQYHEDLRNNPVLESLFVPEKTVKSKIYVKDAKDKLDALLQTGKTYSTYELAAIVYPGVDPTNAAKRIATRLHALRKEYAEQGFKLSNPYEKGGHEALYRLVPSVSNHQIELTQEEISMDTLTSSISSLGLSPKELKQTCCAINFHRTKINDIFKQDSPFAKETLSTLQESIRPGEYKIENIREKKEIYRTREAVLIHINSLLRTHNFLGKIIQPLQDNPDTKLFGDFLMGCSRAQEMKFRIQDGIDFPYEVSGLDIIKRILIDDDAQQNPEWFTRIN